MICPYCDRLIEIKTILGLTLEDIEKLKRFKVEHRFEESKNENKI